MWKVTRDHLDGKDVVVRSRNWDEDAARKATLKFRLRDDDGIVYFSGVCTPETEFEPLDDFGEPGYGCTEVQFKEGRKWVTL